MKRRHLLATAGSALAGGLAGCVGSDPPPIRDAIDRPRAADAEQPESGTGCSDARQRPLSARLTDDPGEDADERHAGCSDPSFAIANERATGVDVRLELPFRDDEPPDRRLDPGERVVLRREVRMEEPLSGTVAVDGDEHTVEWPAESCRRHGIAIVPGDVEIGWIERAAGWGGTGHSCYVGETMPLGIDSRGGVRTVRVTVRDLCTGSERSQRFAFASEGSKLLAEPAVTGRDYEIEVDGLGVDAASATYEGHCQPPRVLIDGDGAVEIGPLGIV